MATNGMPAVVSAGETFKLTNARDVREFTVQPKCEDGKRGVWVCVTCDRVMQNNLQKDCHVADRVMKGNRFVKGPHRLAWFCAEHDCMEVP